MLFTHPSQNLSRATLDGAREVGRTRARPPRVPSSVHSAVRSSETSTKLDLPRAAAARTAPAPTSASSSPRRCSTTAPSSCRSSTLRPRSARSSCAAACSEGQLDAGDVAQPAAAPHRRCRVPPLLRPRPAARRRRRRRRRPLLPGARGRQRRHDLLPAADLEALVAAGGHALQLVVVSACFSHGGGAAFVAAGVPHVIAVKRAERIQDRAAAVFAEAFYYAVLRGGKTVQQAFDIGRSAVANACGIVEAHSEAEKFVLLPHDAPHDAHLFANCAAGEPPRWAARAAVQPSRLIAAHRPPARGGMRSSADCSTSAADSPPSSAPPASASRLSASPQRNIWWTDGTLAEVYCTPRSLAPPTPPRSPPPSRAR